MTRSGHFSPLCKEAMDEVLSVLEGIASTGWGLEGVPPFVERVDACHAHVFVEPIAVFVSS